MTTPSSTSDVVGPSQSSVQDELLRLGDPSGRQDATYWNDWFDIVCCRNRKDDNDPSFEWYCSAEQVVQVLVQYYPPEASHDTNTRIAMKVIHPGSGTSLVPLALLKQFPTSRHYLVDVSEVAMAEMERYFLTLTPAELKLQEALEFVVADILSPPLPRFEKGSLDVWIDKSFLDAMFSSKETTNSSVELEKAARLFDEMLRVLKPGDGRALIVSLAEDHSLQLIVENWQRGLASTAPIPRWKSQLDIWELEPISGNLLAFGFLLTRSNDLDGNGQDELHQASDGSTVVWHASQSDSLPDRVQASGDATLLSSVQEKVNGARQNFLLKCETQKKQNENDRKLLVTLEIKPVSPSVDLVALSEHLRTSVWMLPVDAESRSVGKPLSVHWRPFSSDSNDNVPSLPSFHNIVSIGFGICKLVVQCVIAADDVDALVDAILEKEGASEDFDDEDCDGDDISKPIQSVDVDWDNTIPVVMNGAVALTSSQR